MWGRQQLDVGRPSLGRPFGWLWAAYGASAMGTRLAFGAFPFIAIHVLHSGASAVAVLAAAGTAVGAVVAVPLGPWVEFRRKRPVMIGMDLLRCAALLSIPAAYALGWLGFGQLLAVSVVVAAADITFGAASGAYLKSLLPPEQLLAANARFESTTWTTTVLGPPLGGAAVALLGPVATVVADAVSYLLSALGIRAIGGREPQPPRGGSARLRAGDLLDGWRFVLADPGLRPLFLNTVLVNALVMATEPVLAVLLLGRLGFGPWQYGLTFAVPCLGGLIGSRLSGPLVARHGRRRVLLVSGTLRASCLPGLVLVGPGVPGMLLVMGVEFGMILCIGVFNPVYSASRLQRVAPDRAARVLSAWSVFSWNLLA
ncbi:MFS transporter, partial [Kitasatospora sp. NPDC093558]|uniref:MFS transporter n=1 Tax=Kitasatospora sp. NPDC093558 TaxID=3155201 RepID=UPI0034475D2F